MNPAVSRILLGSLSLFAMGWAIARAVIQSITMDEAFTYVMFVARPSYWRGEANNHTLNTVLMALVHRHIRNGRPHCATAGAHRSCLLYRCLLPLLPLGDRLESFAVRPIRLSRI